MSRLRSAGCRSVGYRSEGSPPTGPVAGAPTDDRPGPYGRGIHPGRRGCGARAGRGVVPLGGDLMDAGASRARHGHGARSDQRLDPLGRTDLATAARRLGGHAARRTRVVPIPRFVCRPQYSQSARRGLRVRGRRADHTGVPGARGCQRGGGASGGAGRAVGRGGFSAKAAARWVRQGVPLPRVAPNPGSPAPTRGSPAPTG